MQSSLILIFLVCTLFTENLVLYILLGTLSIGIGINLFRKNKKDLKSALFYIRTKTAFWKTAVVFIVFCIISIYFNWFIEFEKVFIYIDKVYLLIFPVIIGTLFTSHYSNFVSAIRVYEDGFKLPGTNETKKEWLSVSSFSRTENSLEIQIADKKLNFLIHTEDIIECDKFDTLWKEKKVNS